MGRINIKLRYHFGYLNGDRKIIRVLKCNLKAWVVRMWSVLKCLRIGTSSTLF
jgi:hypothetical protein